ncbi:maleate cis-trans isomerase family protein [Palleronia pelagia]|uniref:Maleate isomerase n=1 Tax=Palleronia pelagia TaxID=387096 RepID=A0A1H8DJL4_9RHOB|nr:aspartate/glutamate racemase family protein [Palleronia pelagia]SEN07450.1 maleate isomerase [Palleronia pelagia]
MKFRYRLEPQGDARTLGLIVLQVDETIERDFRRLFDPATPLHVTRIASGAELTPDTIAAMEACLPEAAAMLPPAADFKVVAYACTSGTTLIGADKVAALVKSGCGTDSVTDPLTASVAAMRALDVDRIGLVSPYIPAVAEPIRAAFEKTGIDVTRSVSFGEEIESRVARIDAASVIAAARHVAEGVRPGAIFLSCTNLRTLDVIPGLEVELGIPVVSSNLALAWDMARRAGLDLSGSVAARLLTV